MKKKLLSIVSVLFCATFFQMPVQAEAYQYELTYEPSYALETEQFSYYQYYQKSSGCFMTTAVDADYIVTGVYEYDAEYDGKPYHGTFSTAITVNYGTQPVYFWTEVNGTPVKPGDMFHINGEATSDFTHIGLTEGSTLEFVGNAADMFGEDFKQVVRHELFQDVGEIENMFWDKRKYSFPDSMQEALQTVYGDVSGDEAVSIVDVLTVNKNLLGLEELDNYSTFAADVNRDGVTDATDSLNILKYVVHLIDDFDSLAG